MKRIALLLAFGIQLILITQVVVASPIPKKVHKILFLGNSITYSGHYVTDIEAWFVLHYPKQHIQFVNVGLPSETVSGLSEPGHAGGKFPRPDLHERLARVLAQTKPDMIFACYGMNDGIYMPFDTGRFQKFKDGIMWLRGQLVATGAKVIHVTPPVFDEVKGGHPGYSGVLDKYSQWLLQLKDSLKWNVVDVHFPMKAYLEGHRKENPAFFFAKDGVHPDSIGHFVMAKQFLLYLGAKQIDNVANFWDIYNKMPNGQQIYALVAKRQSIMKDAWLTATGHKRPGMKTGIPLDEALVKYQELELQIEKLNQ
jgi:lysophospholipase L1-like esterase